MTKCSFNVPADTLEQLKQLAAARGGTRTQVIHDAIRTEAYLSRVIHKGGKVLVKRPDGTMEQLVLRCPP